MKQIILIISAITISLTAISQSDTSLIGRINKSMSRKYDSVNVWWRSPASVPDSIRQLKAPNYPEIVYEKRIANLDELTSIKLEYNDVVLKYIKAYGLSNRPKMQKVIGLSAYYFPIFEEYFAKYGLPLELKYLAAVESSLDPNAISKSGAVGLWQFLKPTADVMGLKVTTYIDERRDVRKSTDAACRYLRYLYETFGDWQLALVAYNGGQGTVKNAIERSGGKTNHWDLLPFFTEQMKNYVGAFIAMEYLMQYHAEHNLFPNKDYIEYMKTDTLQVKGPIHLKNVAQSTGIEYETLKALNPQYLLSYIPNDGEYHTLTMPFDKTTVFLSKMTEVQNVPQQVNDSIIATEELPSTIKRDKLVIHKVVAGDNLFRISMKYSCSINEIKKWNGMAEDHVIHVGDEIKIYLEQ
ncbi:MAG: transglycosylase SLT domain-containing protein [Bacteroidales bacterium]|nr:transglycosylase SLT domain-containing protein [Bacteroidales bacterium]